MISSFRDATLANGFVARGGPEKEASPLRSAMKRTDAPSRSIPRNPVTGTLHHEDQEEALKLAQSFPGHSFPTLISDHARIPYHLSLAKRLKDKQEEKRAQLLSQIRSRSSLPTSTARPPTPPKQRRYGGGAGGVRPQESPTARSTPRRTSSEPSAQHVRGGGRRKQEAKHLSFSLDNLPLQQQPLRKPNKAATDIFGKEVGQLDAFDEESFTELITWTRFRR
jgi:hypothetical protein